MDRSVTCNKINTATNNNNIIMYKAPTITYPDYPLNFLYSLRVNSSLLSKLLWKEAVDFIQVLELY